MDLDDARRGHAQWRERLERAAAGSDTPLDTAATADAGQCAFGAWLQGEGRRRFGEQAAWRHCVQRHAEFHRAAGSVAAAVNRGDTAAARAMLSAGTPFAGAERALLAAIEALKPHEPHEPPPPRAEKPAAAPTAHRPRTPA